MAAMLGFERIEANLRATLAVFSLARPGGETAEIPGMWLVSSQVDYAMFNAATLTAPVQSADDLQARLEAAGRYYAERGLPWSVWICLDWLRQDVLDAVERVCGAAGLGYVSQLPGMVAERIEPPERLLPEVECVRVEDSATREGFTRLMSEAFGVPAYAAHAIYTSEGTWRGPLAGYVGLVDGEMVTSAATVIHAGTVGVYAVGTLPRWQRRGYAEAIMRCALADARARCGAAPSLLQSSAAGYRIYERMGYRTLTRYVVYART